MANLRIAAFEFPLVCIVSFKELIISGIVLVRQVFSQDFRKQSLVALAGVAEQIVVE